MSTRPLTPPVTADDVCRRLMVDRYARSFCLPRYTPAGWWECDLLEITEAGYWREYEIKLTRADFRADQEKTREVLPRAYGQPVVRERKHQLLASTQRGPCQFYYVLPTGLIAPTELPSWAGLLEFSETPGRARPWNIHTRLVVQAPRRHADKIDPAVERHARGVVYWRWMKMLLHDRHAIEGDAP